MYVQKAGPICRIKFGFWEGCNLYFLSGWYRAFGTVGVIFGKIKKYVLAGMITEYLHGRYGMFDVTVTV